MNVAKTLSPRLALVLERDRLVSRIRSWEDKKLVLIHGQAGQGKSTLAAGYVRMLDSPVLWYNIDQEDENPAVFLATLGAAAQRTWPRHVPKLPVIPQNRYGVGGKYQSVTHWFGQVFGGLPEQSLIVFDDYNLPAPRTVPRLLKALIESTPPQVRFMIISRMQPEIEIAKLRARRAVGEITGEDLRFQDDEAARLFADVFGMHLSQKEVSFVNGMAEGWAAGLVLMHEYLTGRDPRERARVLADRHRTGLQTQVFEYLAQEVFSHLPGELQTFFLRTCVSDYLPLPLIAALMDMPNGKEAALRTMTEELLRKNLFVTAADDGVTVIRYHALFREFLLRKLTAQARPGEIKKLYRIAAKYFTDAGDVVRSVDLYLASGQYDKAVAQIVASGQDLLSRGQTQTLLRWIESLPPEYAERPWFTLYRAVACRFSDPRRALALFDEALTAFSAAASRENVTGQMLALSGIIEACFFTGANFERMDAAAAHAAAILGRIGRSSAEARARLLLALGTTGFFTGKLRQGAEALKEALDLFRRAGNHFYQIHSAIYLAPCALYLGDMRLAREAVQLGFDALAAIPEETGGEAALHMAQAMTALFEGNFDEAREAIDRCHGLASEYDLEAIDFLSLDIGGWLKTATGDYEHAERLLVECKRKAEEHGNIFFTSSAAHLLALNALHWNRPGRALAEAEQALQAREKMGSTLFHAVSLAALGAVHARIGKSGQAEKQLAAALAMFRSIGAAQQEATVLLVLARLACRRGKTDECLALLSEAFSIGRERGFTYFSLLTARETAELAAKALDAGIVPEYCETLLFRARMACSGSLRVFTLGGFRAQRGEHTITDGEWKSKRSKALIKLLVAQAGQKIPRDVAIETLWNEPVSEAARMAFSGMLHRVRKILDQQGREDDDGGCIIQEGNLIGLNPSAVWTDVGQFLAHLETAGRMKAKNEGRKAVEEYAKAAALYRGDFLPEDLYEDWTQPVRDRLRSAYLKALEDAGALCDAQGDKAKAAEFHERLFLEDLCNEQACRWLMVWHVANGRRAEAVRLYERCQRALHEELDVEPEAKTKAIYRSIIEQ